MTNIVEKEDITVEYVKSIWDQGRQVSETLLPLLQMISGGNKHVAVMALVQSACLLTYSMKDADVSFDQSVSDLTEAVRTTYESLIKSADALKQ